MECLLKAGPKTFEAALVVDTKKREEMWRYGFADAT